MEPGSSLRNERDQADLEEDLEFLGDAGRPENLTCPTSSNVFLDAESPRTLRQPSSAKQSRLSALEMLKRKRLGQQQESSPTHSITRRGRVVDVESESPSNSELDEDDEDIYEIEDDAPAEDVDDFIVDDGDDERIALPSQFSSFNKAKPKELFKYVVEWMVSKKINPAFSMEDEIYDISFRRLDDFVKGMGGSKYHSSAWTPEFGKSLKSRPILEDVEIGFGLHDKCDACNRTRHPATWQVRFVGETYDTHTLEEHADDDSDSETTTKPDVPSANTTYYVGK